MYRKSPTWYRDVSEQQLQDWRAVGWPAVLTRLGAVAGGLSSDFGCTRRKGRRLIMSCCFHCERTPSLSLYDNGGFVCYGCGQAGSISDFVMIIMDYDQLSDLSQLFDDAFRSSNHIEGQLRLELCS